MGITGDLGNYLKYYGIFLTSCQMIEHFTATMLIFEPKAIIAGATIGAFIGQTLIDKLFHRNNIRS